MNKYSSSLLAIVVIFLMAGCKDPNHDRPNIIILYADDLGYGDLSCYGATEISTPNIDRLANEGIQFLQGYATSATCTPSRYALLTGVYPWRNQRAKVLPGNAPLIIDPDMPTLPKMMQSAGYKTGITGKWHLGLGGENLDWNGPISPGPNDIGFDESFILASTNDRTPTVYVDNDRVYGLASDDPLQVNYVENFKGEPTGRENPEMLEMHPSHGHDMSINNGISRIGFQKGGQSARWVDEYMGDTLLDRSLQFIRDNSDDPFFLFYSFPQIHVPRTPHPRFDGQSGMGPRGDAILEIDYAVEKVLDLLKELDIDQQTIIFFSSDNGPVLDDGYHDSAVDSIGDHTAAGIYRGGKYSLFEAGAHVPFMVRWPKKIEPGSSEALVSQHDIFSSLSGFLQQPMSKNDGLDLMQTFLGKTNKGREELILEALGNTYYRQGEYVLIPPYEGSNMIAWGPEIESGRSAEYQLYDLQSDPEQKLNLALYQPGKLLKMMADYEAAFNR